MSNSWDAFEVKQTIENLKKGINTVGNEFRLQVTTLDNHLGDFGWDNGIAEMIAWDVLKEATGETNLYKICEKVCTQDEARTIFLNDRYNDVYVLPKVFKPEFQELIKTKMLEALAAKEKELSILQAQIELETKQEDEFKNTYTLVSVKKLTEPKGGEEGVDGFADVTVSDGQNNYNFLERNVFDFGYYNYPVRLNGSDDIFHQETWTEAERTISKWLSKYGPLKNKSVRM